MTAEHENFTGGINREAAAGMILVAAAGLAMVAANSPLSQLYDHLLETEITLGIAPLALTKNIIHWVNDGLMALFFFLVGLEIKREVTVGALADPKKASLPVIAALGGMIFPAMIYAAITWSDPIAIRGWAIPAATDIAFALGILALLGNRVPAALKVFLLALAIIDDLGAIIIIAVFYSAKLSAMSLAFAAAGLLALYALNRSNVMRIWPYLFLGFFVWLCVLKSGVHATIAGVATALMIPVTGQIPGKESPLEYLEHKLQPWITFAILPIFAFANAGVSLTGITPGHLLTKIPLAIALGLFFGKTVGIYSFARAAIRAGLGVMPAGATRLQLLGVSTLGGIGFTMSLFIGSLAFPGSGHAADLRIGVLSGSIVSAIVGYMILRRAYARSST